MTKILSHLDADGITAGILLAKALNLEATDISCPAKFGDVSDVADYVVDMRPYNAYHGIVIDHHDGHALNPTYKLIWDTVPASVIVFNNFADKIPEKEKWKVAVGANGDGQPASIPTEVWRKFPELLEKEEILVDGGTRVESTYRYKLLSAPINAAARMNRVGVAIASLFDAQSIDDILSSPLLIDAQEKINSEVKRVMEAFGKRAYRPLSIGPFGVCEYSSEFKIGGRIAIKFAELTKQTILAINARTGGISIRGDLAGLATEVLMNAGIKAGGHCRSGFTGAELDERQSARDVEKMLRGIWRNCSV